MRLYNKLLQLPVTTGYADSECVFVSAYMLSLLRCNFSYGESSLESEALLGNGLSCEMLQFLAR